MAKKDVVDMQKIKKNSKVDSLGAFVIKNRVVLIVVVAVIVAGLVGFSVFTKVSSTSKEKALSAIEKAEYTLSYQTAGLTDEELVSYYDNALSAVEGYTAKAGIVGARASVLAAEIYYRKNNFEAARDSYINAAKKVKGTYLAPLCYFNAGSACEELNDTAKALEYYELAVNDKEFADPTRALFAVGRIKMATLDYNGAKEAFEKIIASNNQQDPWFNAAKTCIISMQIDGKIE